MTILDWPTILLNMVGPVDIFHGFTLPGNLGSWVLEISVTVKDFIQRFLIFLQELAPKDYLYKCLLKKPVIWTHNSYRPFYWNSQEKHFSKGILVRKCPCVVIRGEFRTLSNNKGGAKSLFLFWQKTPSWLTGFYIHL